jgi:hypothetical protein
MKYFFILLTSLSISISSMPNLLLIQIKTVINKMFTAMKNSDGPMLQSVFADQVIFQTITRDKEGNTIVKTEDAAAFIEQVSKAEPNSLDEQISFEGYNEWTGMVKADGPLAIAWTPYRFFYKGKFSHCGVNSFQLVRLNGEWKIQYLIDTRRKTDCGVE